MTSLLRIFVGMAFLASLVATAKAGAIIEGDPADAMLGQASINSNESQAVGGFYTGENLAMVEPFALPYLAPGQLVTNATISFYYENTLYGTPTANVQLYGLTRVSATSSAPINADWYVGANDTANALLNAKFVTPTSPTNQVCTYTGGNLVSFIQKQYANSAFSGLDTAYGTRFIFFRLSPDASQTTWGNYQFASARYPTRAWRPTLSLTISNGVTNVAGRLQFSFTLPTNAVTSAGVYNTSTGTLIRTLWNNVRYASGTNYGLWDGKDSSGNVLSTGTSYQIKLIYHNVQYVWDGTVGNTSLNQSGTQVHRSFSEPTSMAIAGGVAYYSVGYNELADVFRSFNVGNPQVCNEVKSGFSDCYSAMTLVAADATRSYWLKSSNGVGTTNTTYIMAITNSTQAFYTFPQGTALPASEEFGSCIDYANASPTQPATGLAVQQSGSYLFAAHGPLNLVRVYDKVQGNLVGSFTVTNPSTLATTANGDVWVVSNGTTLQRYTFANGTATLKNTINGLSNALGMAVSADDATLVVTDGGSSDQIKAFSNSTGSPLFTYGNVGGMDANGPSINANTFYFHAYQSFVAFQADNTFWVGDGANRRTVHFSISNNTLNYIEQIAYAEHNYASAVDVVNPTRVFNTLFEYSTDYSKPLGGTNGSWSMVNNWAAGLLNDTTHNYVGFRSGFNNVATLTNGHTYAILNNFATSKWDLVELSMTGPARVTGYTFDYTPRIYPDGSLRYNIQTSTTLSYYSQPLTGFDANNNPKWGSPSLLATTQIGTNDPQTWDTFPERTEVTSSGLVVNFDPYQGRSGYHLGAIAKGGTAWQWRASPSTTSTYTGWFPQDGTFDIGNGVQYSGNQSMVAGRNIICGYHGEFWKNNEASQWFDFYDNGLLVSIFGTYGGYRPNLSTTTDGFAGNSFSPDMVRANGTVYLYCNDESNHAGTCRWRIDGLDNVTEIKAISTVGSTAVLAATSGPSVTITSPTAGASYYNGNKVLLSAEAGSGSGTGITAVQFFDGTTSLGTVTTAPYDLVTTAMGAGSHVITATATDGITTVTSPAVSITIGSDGTNTAPPAPVSLSAGTVADQSVALNWVQPAASPTSSGIGQIVSFQCDYVGDSTALSSTSVAGAAPYAVSNWNILGRVSTGGLVYLNPVTNSGVTIPNLGANLYISDSGSNGSTSDLTGSAANIFGSGAKTLTAIPGITISNVPFANYDLVVYSLAGGLSSGGTQSVSITTSNSLLTGTVTLNFNALPTTYNVSSVPFGTSATLTNVNTVVISGMTSQSFELLGADIAGFQIVERPYDQGLPASYSIERAPSGGSFAAVGTAAGNSLSFTDTNGLTAGTTYQYRIKAVNSYGSSAYSNVITVTTTSTGTTGTGGTTGTSGTSGTGGTTGTTGTSGTSGTTGTSGTSGTSGTTGTTTLTGFAAWQAKYFTAAQLADPSISGPNADPYGSGVKNLVAYALQLDPTTAQTSNVPHATNQNGHLSLAYVVPAAVTDVTFIVEVSTDLQTWHTGTGYTALALSVTGPSGQTMIVRDTLPSTATKRFMRLRVTNP